ncbi:Zinc finger MYND domain-containing protein 10 [Folsomia candida]|uniref:Zinc finger MYND domain-containing protein 10 n=1 Tax=Folsomia candida TaxID=158441 RepID=A0A226E4G9_FOLCA|nr:Zinc finger MYND domain-containing protein 10 [Folsomia candida]
MTKFEVLDRVEHSGGMEKNSRDDHHPGEGGGDENVPPPTLAAAGQEDAEYNCGDEGGENAGYSEEDQEEDPDADPSNRLKICDVRGGGGLDENGDNNEEEDDEDMSNMASLGVANNLSSLKMEVDCDEDNDNSSTGSTSSPTVKNQLDSYLGLLERDQQQLNTLMVLKEREWDAILKLKKLKEIKIARIKRRRALDEMLGTSSLSTSGGGTVCERVSLDKNRRNSCNSNNAASSKVFRQKLIVAESCLRVGNKREVEVRNNIRTLEKDVHDLAKEVFTAEQQERSLDFEDDQPRLDEAQTTTEGAFLASNALKSLVKFRTTGHSPGSVTSSPKIVGEGRQGPKVDVTALIADYRLKTDYDKESPMRRSITSNSTLPSLTQCTGVSFTDILSKIKTRYEKDKEITASPPSMVATPLNNIKQSVQTSTKAKGAASSANTLLSGSKPPAGTTLAKLLSANNGNSMNRALEDSAVSRDESVKKKSDAAAVPLCQGCHANKAQFVCAGCGNQWYCSRECQVAAWDDHAETCSG